jgi:methionyl-tRNA formyltransferase|tara:strand:+ start:13710 stop:14321 length:612 start_codon:yes stop_codon:yes gene_type:complete
MNVVLLGKGTLAIRIAEWFAKNENLVYVVPDTPEPTWTDSLTNWCKSNNISFLESGDYEMLPDIKIDLAMSVFYGKIIKKDFIDKCKNIINLHNAPLPKYRGVRPINWALKNGEYEHGVTIHKIHEGIDDGDILGRVTYPLYPETEEVEDVYNKSLEYGWMLFNDVISKIEYVIQNARPQPSDFSYYSSKQNKLLGDREGFKR